MKPSGTPSSALRLLFSLALGAVAFAGFSTTVSAQLTGQALAALNAYNSHYHPTTGAVTLSTSSVSITATDLTAMIGYSGSQGVITTGSLATVLANIDSTLQIAGTSAGAIKAGAANVASGAVDLLTGAESVLAGLTGTAYTSNFVATVNVLANDSYYTGPAAGTKDATETTIVGDALTHDENDYATILTNALTVTDPNGVQQATLLAAETTTAKLSAAGASFQNVMNSVGVTDGTAVGTGTNEGSFLYTMLTKETTSATRQSVLAGYIGGYAGTAAGTGATTPGALATTASNIMVYASSPTSTFASQNDVFEGFVVTGTTAGSSENTTIADVAPEILGLYNKAATTAKTAAENTDAARATLAGTFITDYTGNFANTIAKAAASVIEDPTDDAFSFTSTITGNANVKASADPTNGLVNVTETIAAAFTGTAGLEAQVTQAGAKNAPTASLLSEAQAIANGVAAANMTAISGTAAQLAFAESYVQGVDAPGTNWSAENAATRAAFAIGVMQEADTLNIVGGAPIISGTAIATVSTLTNFTGVAVPILLAYTNVNGSETGAIAATLSHAGTAANTAVTLTANLIANAKVAGSTALNPLEIAQIADGAVSDSTNDLNNGGEDNFLSLLAAQLKADTTTAAPELLDVALGLSGTTGFTDTQVVGDIAQGLSSVRPTSAAATSGTVAAIVAQAHSTDAPAIAYAASVGVGPSYSGATAANADGYIYTIAEDVLKITGTSNGTAAAAITGSSGMAINGGAADLGLLAKDMTALSLPAAANIALAASQSLAPGDGSEHNVGLIATDVVGATGFTKNAANLSNLVITLAQQFTGAYYSGGTPTGFDYTSMAELSGTINKVNDTVVSLGNAIVSVLIPAEVLANGTDPGTAATIAGTFEQYLSAGTAGYSGSNALAIENATLGVTYASALNPTQTGIVAANVANNLPSANALNNPYLSGSLAVTAATNAVGTVDDLNMSLQGVADAYPTVVTATSSYLGVASALAGQVTNTTGTTAFGAALKYQNLAIPSIVQPFAIGAGLTETSAANFLKSVIAKGGVFNVADEFGVLVEFDTALQSAIGDSIVGTTPFTTLVTALDTDIGTAGFAALAALPNGVFTGTMNAAADKTKLQTLLQEAFTAGVNNSYLNITADVSAVVPM